jgi:hypothetical protein
MFIERYVYLLRCIPPCEIIFAQLAYPQKDVIFCSHQEKLTCHSLNTRVNIRNNFWHAVTSLAILALMHLWFCGFWSKTIWPNDVLECYDICQTKLRPNVVRASDFGTKDGAPIHFK